MNLITTIPIYRNRFQKPTLFFSSQNFPAGSLIFIPSPKTTKTQKRKPALVIQIEDLEKQKFFLRKNKIEINGLDDSIKFDLLKKPVLDLILQISDKTALTVPKILQKIFTKKIVREMNQLSPSQTTINQIIQRFNEQLTPTSVTQKIRKGHTPTNRCRTPVNKKGEIQTIGSILTTPTKKKSSIHSEKHYLVDEIRSYFGEKSKKGVGSFSFYLGFFRKIPEATIYQYWADVKGSRKSTKDQQKLFWWKIGQFLKEKKNK